MERLTASPRPSGLAVAFDCNQGAKFLTMSQLTFDGENARPLKDFTIHCNSCGSVNTQLDIDWAAYDEGAWNNTTLICKDCGKEETLIGY